MFTLSWHSTRYKVILISIIVTIISTTAYGLYSVFDVSGWTHVISNKIWSWKKESILPSTDEDKCLTLSREACEGDCRPIFWSSSCPPMRKSTTDSTMNEIFVTGKWWKKTTRSDERICTDDINRYRWCVAAPGETERRASAKILCEQTNWKWMKDDYFKNEWCICKTHRYKFDGKKWCVSLDS